MKLYKSGLALKREGTDETVAAFINEQDLDNVLEAVMTKKKPNKPVPGDESTERMASTTPAPVQQAAPSDELQFNATRLRNVARLVGLESAVPQDDATLDGARGSVLGMIAGQLRIRAISPAPGAAPDQPVGLPEELRKLCGEMVKLHAESGTVLTIHMEEMQRLLDAQPVGLSDERISAILEHAYCPADHPSEPGMERVMPADLVQAVRAILAASPVGLSEQDKLDAARYRALRDPDTDFGIGATDCNHIPLEGKKLDIAVDAILAAKEAP